MAVIARQVFSAISALGIATMRAKTGLGYPLRKSVKLVTRTRDSPNQSSTF